MRVIAGEFRSRKLIAVEGTETRPTSDRLRETLFNILNPEIEGTIFIDAYAGTGAVGIEAISRGARHCLFIEKNKSAMYVIQENLRSLKIGSKARVVQGLASLLLAQNQADIVFLDPPFEKEREYQAAFDALERKPPKLIVVQHSKFFTPPEECGELKKVRVVKQGDNALSFYRVPITTQEDS